MSTYYETAQALLHPLLRDLAPDLLTVFTVDKPRTRIRANSPAIPRLPESHVIVLPLIREAVAPLIVRNDTDLTDLVLPYPDGTLRRHIRLLSTKTKGVERRRGAAILRTLQLGGAMPTHRAVLKRGQDPAKAMDLNTLLFGDSVLREKTPLPIHAAVLYSDALSLQDLNRDPIATTTFQQGGVQDDGGNYDPDTGNSSANIFSPTYVLPGTYFIQTLVLPGRRLTGEALLHLLLAVGLAGSYGGGTARTGTNLRTHLAGLYWGPFEQPLNAPAVLLHQWYGQAAPPSQPPVPDVLAWLSTQFQAAYPHQIGPADLLTAVTALREAFAANENGLHNAYVRATDQSHDLFRRWFRDGKKAAANNSADSDAHDTDSDAAADDAS